MTRSALLCKALDGCWRPQPPEIDLSASDLQEIAPILHGSGAAALAWWKLRGSSLEAFPEARQLQQVWRLQVLRNALRESEIEQLFALFRSAGVEPILVKGWAAACHYAEPSLRPHGDIDLILRPEQRRTAAALLKAPDAKGWNVDLTHPDVAGMESRDFDEIDARTQLVELGQSSIRVLGAEDHLRFLCAHLLRHGAWRPLWLCDVAAALEARPTDFDWDWCLRGDRREGEWVGTAAGLAHQLVGAQVDNTPLSKQASHSPAWLVPATLKQWENAFYVEHPLLQPIWSSLWRPRLLPEALRSRWPGPIEATALTGAPFNEIPRLIFQLSLCLHRMTAFLLRPLRPQQGHQF